MIKNIPYIKQISPFLLLIILIFTANCSFSDWFQGTSANNTKKVWLISQPRGEKEFLAGSYNAAVPQLTLEAANGNLRAIFFMRIIYQHGLGQTQVQPQMAQKTLDYLALRFQDLEQLAQEAPEPDRALDQTALGHLYYLGLTPDKKPDLDRAERLISRAADNNFWPAVNLMTAIAFAQSQPGDKTDGVFDSPGFIKWAQKGADQKDILAMGNLSSFYRRGLGVEANQYTASSWSYAAATGPNPAVRSQNDMGFFYEQGNALSVDRVEASRWYKMAAQRGYLLAQANLARIAAKTDGPGQACDTIDY